VADENTPSSTFFVGLGEADENKSFTSVPTKIVAHFRRIYFRRHADENRLFHRFTLIFVGFWPIKIYVFPVVPILAHVWLAQAKLLQLFLDAFDSFYTT
jgi:hypothetical protein